MPILKIRIGRLLVMGVICAMTPTAMATRWGAAPALDMTPAVASKPKAKKAVQKVLFTIVMEGSDKPDRFAEQRKKALEKCNYADVSNWGIFKSRKDGRFYRCEQNVSPPDHGLGEGLCYVDPGNGNVFSTVTEEQKKRFMTVEYVGYIAPFAAYDARARHWILDAKGLFATLGKAYAALDAEYNATKRTAAEKAGVECGALVFADDGGYRKTNLIQGEQRGEIGFPEPGSGKPWLFDLESGEHLIAQPEFQKSVRPSPDKKVKTMTLAGRWHSHPSHKNFGCLFSGTDHRTMKETGVASAISDSGELCMLEPGSNEVHVLAEDGGKRKKEYDRANFPTVPCVAGDKTQPAPEDNYYLPPTDECDAVRREAKTDETGKAVPSAAEFFGTKSTNKSSRKVFGQ